MKRFLVTALVGAVLCGLCVPAHAQTPDQPGALFYAGEFGTGVAGAWGGTYAGWYLASLVLGEGAGGAVGQPLGMALGGALGVHGFAVFNAYEGGHPFMGLLGALAGQTLASALVNGVVFGTGLYEELSNQQIGLTFTAAGTVGSAALAVVGYHLGRF